MTIEELIARLSDIGNYVGMDARVVLRHPKDDPMEPTDADIEDFEITLLARHIVIL